LNATVIPNAFIALRNPSASRGSREQPQPLREVDPQARRAPLRARRLAGSRDGKGKAWVRFYDGDEAIVGGSRIER
jgi:hypothetical protein